MTDLPMSAAIDAQDFRNAMARFASGVMVVITRDRDGAPAGFTASAFSSLSLDPPLILVCLDKRAECAGTFEVASGMTLSMMRDDQLDVALRFATRGIDKFEGVPVVDGPETGIPLIVGAPVQLECRMFARHEGGDHTILVGEVTHVATTTGEPLVHYNRSFGRFSSC